MALPPGQTRRTSTKFNGCDLESSHANVRSIVAPGRKLAIEQLTKSSSHGIDILCLTETWLKPKHLDSYILLPGFQKPFRLDRTSSRGGGVAVYLRNGITCRMFASPNIFNNRMHWNVSKSS